MPTINFDSNDVVGRGALNLTAVNSGYTYKRPFVLVLAPILANSPKLSSSQKGQILDNDLQLCLDQTNKRESQIDSQRGLDLRDESTPSSIP